MRLTILFFLLLFLPIVNNVFAIGSINEPPVQKQTHTAAQKKQSFKEKLLLKWFTKQLRKKATLEQPKKIVNTLGYLSLTAGILAPILIFLTGAIASYGFAAFVGIFSLALIPTAIILGILSLLKRKKLKDKSGTSAVPAIIGLIAGSIYFIIFIIALLTFTFNYSG
jgi:hypothetical protein